MLPRPVSNPAGREGAVSSTPRQGLICGRLWKKATSRAAVAAAAKLGDSQMMSFMGFS